MSSPIISVEQLGKCYRLQHQAERQRYTALRDVIAEKVGGILRKRSGRETTTDSEAKPRPASEDFWALKDVSFEVKQGEVVGIIGRNGAGKSTLLKILSRITEPTLGRVKIRGRVASLLEVGTGFHPELTGRENIFLNGAILGMTRVEIKKKFDAIVAFAEVAKFLDTPVKRYSSGMYVRLAFAVAAHLEPEILIVDEVLAVGDAAFQSKCLGKMGEVAKGGRTVLFVSHNMGAITRLCQRCLLLEEGNVLCDSDVPQAIESYLGRSTTKQIEKLWTVQEQKRSDPVFVPLALRIRNKVGATVAEVRSCDPFVIEFEYQLLAEVRDMRIGIYLQTSQGEHVVTSFDRDDTQRFDRWMTRKAGRYVNRCPFPAHLLDAGLYVLGCNAGVFGIRGLFTDEHALSFGIEAQDIPGSRWNEPRSGILRPYFDWDCQRVGAEVSAYGQADSRRPNHPLSSKISEEEYRANLQEPT